MAAKMPVLASHHRSCAQHDREGPREQHADDPTYHIRAGTGDLDRDVHRVRDPSPELDVVTLGDTALVQVGTGDISCGGTPGCFMP